MRALLVVNPKATTTSERSRDVLVRALRSEVDLTVAYTRRRGHAATLAREAAAEGVQLVVTLGGDGTVNEAVNGLMAAADKADNRPALAVVPGGSTNVFARAVGMPRDWAEGVSVILEALREERSRTIGLGRADDRYFTFCAGLGIDAEVVRRVERARLRGRTSTPALYLRSTMAQYFLATDRRHPPVTLERPGEQPESGLATVIVQNSAPWTYLGDRPVNPCPDASFETGLDVMAMRQLRVPSTTRTVGQILSRRPAPHGKRVLNLHDLESFTLRADRPMAFQVDGDYLGERDKVEFHSVPEALRIAC
ncbi:diacylglycerol/lipid kinase family protein [Planosporangium sp. 12N6]|uniref:diacylglycerol/lipid kinase family protein n=1 Tax=Planosporangium spinosum TaxID=3402278 RepID=UPI003CF6A4EE